MPRLASAVLVTLALAAPTSAQPHLWLEAEAAKADPVFQITAPGKAEYLSGGKWLAAAVEPGEVAGQVPAGGATVTFRYAVEEFGTFDLWARVGYEFARSPFRWRADFGDWKVVAPDELTTDLMAVADGAGVAWLKLGSVSLPAGTRTLEFNVPRDPGRKLLFGLDCVCLSRTAFTPNGPHPPGNGWQRPIDREAGEATFEFPAAGPDPAARRQVRLAGLWQIARYDEPGEVQDRTGPVPPPADPDALFWRALRVPGDKDAGRPEWAYCHRYLLRTRVRVPGELAGRSFLLRFPNNALTTTVYVNGKSCGHSAVPCAAWECDISAAVRPGEVNDILVGIKDLYYAVAKTPDGKSCRHLFHLSHDQFHAAGDLGPTRHADFPVLGRVRRNGILETPTLTAAGPVHTADVFCAPSVGKKRLGLEIEVRNPGADPAAVEVRNVVYSARPDGSPIGPVQKTFAAKAVTVPAGKGEVVSLAEEWENPRLWWPDDPHQYVVETTILRDSRPVDRVHTKFGFREWGRAGRAFTLNGVPWQLRADRRHAGPDGGREPEAAVAEWRRNGQTMFRFGGEVPWTGRSQANTLDFFDAAGVPVHRVGLFDGGAAGYQLVSDGKPNAPLFDRWREQLAAWVKAERNHPSVFVWSVENEVVSVNAQKYGWRKEVEPEVRKAAELVMRLDPTRPAMSDGGALADPPLPVAGVHRAAGDGPAVVPGDRPVVVVERFPAAGARLARERSEDYRWQGVAAFHLDLDAGADAAHHRAWQPVCVLKREADATLLAGATVKRTLKVFNDTRFDSPITVHSLFETAGDGGVKQARGKRVVRLKPGASEEFVIDLETPKAASAGRLVLTCERDGREVFRDVTPLRVIDPPAGKK